MKYVIIRDDDINALTPVACLEKLYRPFFDRGLPVNLATIPCVNTSTKQADGRPEGFLQVGRAGLPSHLPLASNRELLDYLAANPLYHLLYHGFAHDYMEFDSRVREDIVRRLDEGDVCFDQAGLRRPQTFVAPYDKISRTAYEELGKRFQVISTGWFELARLPVSWWGFATARKLNRRRHWQVGSLRLLSHPGYLLSYQRPTETMFDTIKTAIAGGPLTVLVTHWWEYFVDGKTNEPYLKVLHQVAEYLATTPDVKVVSFAELETGALRQDPNIFGTF